MGIRGVEFCWEGNIVRFIFFILGWRKDFEYEFKYFWYSFFRVENNLDF